MCSFYENSHLKNAIRLHYHKSFRNLKSNCYNNLIFSELGTSDLSKFVNMKKKTLHKTRKRETMSYNKTIGSFFFGVCLGENHCSRVDKS